MVKINWVQIGAFTGWPSDEAKRRRITQRRKGAKDEKSRFLIIAPSSLRLCAFA